MTFILFVSLLICTNGRQLKGGGGGSRGGGGGRRGIASGLGGRMKEPGGWRGGLTRKFTCNKFLESYFIRRLIQVLKTNMFMLLDTVFLYCNRQYFDVNKDRLKPSIDSRKKNNLMQVFVLNFNSSRM